MTANIATQNAVPPETHQFDFWLGEWDVSWQGGRGTNSIRSILDGYVVEERFHSDAIALHGISLSVYSAQRGQWQQTWVDSQGSYLDLAGGWDGERMILTAARIQQGKSITLRMVFYNIAPDQLDWVWEHSKDAGQTWEQLWQIHYQRKPSKDEYE